MGFSEPYQHIAPPATMQITLDNTSGAFNMGNPSALFAGLLQPDVLVRVSATVEGVTSYLVTLKIVGVSLVPNSVGLSTAVLSCADWHGDMMNTIYDPPPIPTEWMNQGYFRTDRIIGDAFSLNGAVPMFPSANAWWIMGASEMGVNTITADYESATGYLIVAYGGIYGSVNVIYYGNNTDAQGQGTSLISFFEEICAAEMDGRFKYVTDPTSGKPRYWYIPRNCLAAAYNASSTRTVRTSQFSQVSYIMGANLCNQIEITLYPRAVGTAGSELASIGSSFRLRAGEKRELTLRYRNPDNPNESCAATTLVEAVPGADYVANSAEDGSGSDLTASLNVVVSNQTNAANISLDNQSGGDLYVTTLKVRGTPLTAGSPITVRSVDAQSMKNYGIQRQAKTIAGIDDVELVQRYADWYVRRFSAPRNEFRTVSFPMTDQTHGDLKYYALNAQYFSLTGIRIADDWAEAGGTVKPYFVAGVQHVIANGQWMVTLLLEDYSAAVGIWKMGDPDLSIIGQTARLGF